MHLLMFDRFQNGEMPTVQHISTTNSRSTEICTILQLPLCCKRCNVRSIRDAHLKADITLVIPPKIILLSTIQRMMLIVALWLFSHGESHLGPEKRKLWSNSSERTQGNENRQMEDNSCPRRVESQLRALQDNDIRQSRKVLELQKKETF